MFAGSVELIRDLPWKRFNLSVAVFGDVGNAFDHFGDPLMYFGRYRHAPAAARGLGGHRRGAGADHPRRQHASGPGPRLHLNFSPKL